MRRLLKPKLKPRSEGRGLNALRKANEELDRTAKALIRTDYLLHRANERFDQQISQLHALHRIGSSINSTFDLELILSGISESMTKDLDFEKSGIVFLEKNLQRPMQSQSRMQVQKMGKAPVREKRIQIGGQGRERAQEKN